MHSQLDEKISFLPADPRRFEGGEGRRGLGRKMRERGRKEREGWEERSEEGRVRWEVKEREVG